MFGGDSAGTLYCLPRKMTPPRKKKYVPAVGPKLNRLLAVVFGLFALLAVNAVYLLGVRLLGLATGRSYENWFYLIMFLGHLALGLLFVLPVIVFGLIHMKNTHERRNRRAVRVGYALFVAALVLLASGVVLTRLKGVIDVKDPGVRSVAWWLHVITPVAAAWLFVLHRLAGKRIRWRVGIRWAAVAAVLGGAMLVLQAQDPRAWDSVGNQEGEKYFFPSLARTVTGDFIPARVLQNDDYCVRCHADAHADWARSVHRFSSFNNPPYLFSVTETRKVSMEKDGNVNRSRWCAGCHDPVPFFSGKFSDPDYDMKADPTAHAGITCTVCHAITNVNSPKGNADYTIEEPIHYPFAFSDDPLLRWVNEQLVLAKPEFHKKTFLKPLHKTAEFCGTCHKVHLPPELNDYKWLRGQNHYDAYLLSGVSGHGVTSWYYPPKAETNCNGCHMPLAASEDFGARDRDDSGVAKIHDHQFPSANTAIPKLAADLGRISPEAADEAIAAHREFEEGVMRIDVFGVRKGGRIDGELVAPIRPEVPMLAPGESYLLETVVRTVKMGHLFTQGTVDSNEVWVEVTARLGDRVIGKSGGMREPDRAVDPWAHFLNAFVLDRDGNRIDRRNAQDIFVPLYNHQIPPGAADTLHYRLDVPADAEGAITIEARLRYRKFDTGYMRMVMDDPDTPEVEAYVNDLPILELARDEVTFPIAAEGSPVRNDPSPIPEWQRWNDYGIGLFRKGERGQLRQAEEAFRRVEELGRPDGPINLARVYLKEGRVGDEAPAALRRARAFDPPAREWSLLWFAGQVDKQNGELDEAIANFRQILDGGFAAARGRGFDFTKDYRLLNALASTIYERAKQERGEARAAERERRMREAERYYLDVLEIDPENMTAHWGLKQVYADLGEREKSEEHERLHAKYKPDDNARDFAVAAARRRYPAANHAAEAVVIYDLGREAAYDLPPKGK